MISFFRERPSRVSPSGRITRRGWESSPAIASRKWGPLTCFGTEKLYSANDLGNKFPELADGKGWSYPALGAPHAIELAYVFNTLKAGRAGEGGRSLARKLMKYWVRFSETGNPIAKGLPAWPEYDSKESSYLELGDELKTGAELGKRTCDALDRFTSRAYSTMEAKD
tara:strand:- start:649 stop:1152 length:504 start_codon:yes stop_codon:yes gene_type:complete